MNCAIYVLLDSKQFASSNLHVELALAANVVLSGRVVPLELAQQLFMSGV